MNILIVIAIPCCYMASFVRSAPLPELPGVNRTLVEDPGFQELVERSHSLIQKVLLSIPEAHKSCIHTETLQLNSAENAKLVVMAANIGIPSAPVLKVVSDNFTLETCLSRMSEGIQLHRALLSAVLPRLDKKDRVNELLADTRDLLVQIHKMQKMVQGESAVQPTPPALNLRLPGEYEVQVATHLTLVQLQSFGQDMVRSLRSLQQSSEEETES
ncbi:colony stimulating factor 3 (granulocyte) a [Myripristis murdjan]|uniref:colony stimulating factor 3 (granulocyte) a n=1 Tax=Myripristis murdjan TaxID=586833 RepID=UPI0011760EEC|nr:uncharacterized protein LOC115377876 [Myripristis murdjan]